MRWLIVAAAVIVAAAGMVAFVVKVYLPTIKKG